MQHFRIGLRTFKTATAVAICLVVSYLIGHSPVLSGLAAVYCLRTSTATSLHFSRHRVFGTTIGVFISMLAVFIQGTFPRTIYLDAAIVFFGVILIILFCNLTRHPEGIVTSVSTFLIICFNTPVTESVSYAFSRIFDVFIGALVAVTVDYILPGQKEDNQH